MEHRLSQRQPRACQECTKRKRKCDKQIPCGRCRRLDHHCVREQVRLRRSEGKHAGEISFLQQLAAALDNPAAARAKLRARLDDLRQGIDSTESSSPPRVNETQARPETPEDLPGDASGDTAAEDVTPALSALEQMAWGRGIAACFPHTKCSCAHRQRAEASTGQASSLIASLALPEPVIAGKLIGYHLGGITWHHNCLHTRTFIDQCRLFWNTGVPIHEQWICLYLAVLGTTLFCLRNSEQKCEKLGIDMSDPSIPSAHKMFEQMVNLLYASNFMGELSLYSVQAIVVSTEIAHNLGYSQLNAVLFGAAIRIAQCLGLDKIGPAASDTADANDLIQITLGQRVWCQMLIQDLFAIPFNGSYAIMTSHTSTELPANCDDDLIVQNDTKLTQSTYTRVLASLAVLMPELADGLGSAASKMSPRQQYAHVLRMDQKMRDVVKAIPPVLLRQVGTERYAPSWLTLARRSLAVTAADKIIMIHRPFIFRAFHSTAYSYTRRTCVAASMTILREHQAIVESGDISVWTHTAFCITAAVILSLEILYHSEPESAIVETYRRTVQAARERLQDRKDDVLAARGVALIDVVASESNSRFRHADGGQNGATIDTQSIMEKFFAVDQQGLVEPATTPSLYAETSDPFFDSLINPDDFEAWFSSTFTKVHGLDG